MNTYTVEEPETQPISKYLTGLNEGIVVSDKIRFTIP